MQNKQLEVKIKERINKLLTLKVDDIFFNSVMERADKLLLSDNDEILYFLLPLIERLTLELLDLDIDSDIERFNQGVYRPLTTIIKKETNKVILVKKLGEESYNDLASIFFGNDSLRERYLKRLCHVNDNKIINKVKDVVLSLLEAYKKETVREKKYNLIKKI